ncbi:MAG: alpha/beta hydrolase family protein [Ignavibacteria bacterium]
MKSIKLFFKNKYGLRLAAFLDCPSEAKPIAYSVFAHCFTCSKDLKLIPNIDKALSHSGIATLRFDFTGIGESEGNFPDTNFSSEVEDIISAAEFLRLNYMAPQLLIGHSLGGCAAIAAAKNIPSVNAVVTIGTPSEPSNMSIKLQRTKERASKEGIAETTIGGLKFRFKKQFFDDVESYRIEPILRNLKKPLLILHSPKDSYTAIENAGRIFQAAKHPKSFVSLDNMDHLMLNKNDAYYVGSIIASWVKRYLK